MTERLVILTGASRGLGAAMARRLLAPRTTLLCLSRRIDASLVAASGATLEQWPVDLAAPAPVAIGLDAWLRTFDPGRFATAALVNNAAALTRIGPIEACTGDELSAGLRVGLEAPLLLSAAFLRATAGWHADRRVLNISSGLGRRAMAGQATYCAVKGGLDHLSRALALDQQQLPNGARVVSLAPGVIDTEMQQTLRSAIGPGFPDQPIFIGLKDNGQLQSADVAAQKVLAYLDRSDFGDTVVADIRDA